MKIPAKGASRFLAKEDIDTPIIAHLGDVQVESLRSGRDEQDKFILYFQERDLKPMVLNVLNRKVIIASYGDESDLWRGKPVEIFVDPNVTMGGDVVGGIRLRIPVANGPRPFTPARNVKPVPTTPIPTRQAAPAAKPPLNVDQKHVIVVNGYKSARDEAKVQEFAAWAAKQDFAQHHVEEQSDAYHEAMERLGVDVSTVHADNSIPF